jgi:hypothetical protein
MTPARLAAHRLWNVAAHRLWNVAATGDVDTARLASIAAQYLEELETLAGDLTAAWTIPGPVPAYHRDQIRRLRLEWPALAKSVDALAHAEALTERKDR